MKKILALLMVICICFALSSTAFADDWKPSGDVVFVIPYGPGGSSDACGRVFSTAGAAYFDANLIITNIAGGSCALGYTEVIQSKPDGQTICLAGNAAATAPLVMETPYVYTEEFKPICMIARAPFVVYVNSSSNIYNLDDLVNEIKTREVIMGTAQVGSATHVELEYLAKKVESDITTIAYDGGASAIAALLGNNIDVTVQAPSDGAEYVKSGDLRPIAVLSDYRLENGVYDDIETCVEQGYEYLQSGFYQGVAAPKDTPDEIIKYYENAFKSALEDPTVIETIESYGYTINFLDGAGYADYWQQTIEGFSAMLEYCGDRLIV